MSAVTWQRRPFRHVLSMLALSLHVKKVGLGRGHTRKL